MKIVYSLNDKHKKDLLFLYQNAWWSHDRTYEDIDIILSKSSFVIGIIKSDTDQLIAFSRVLTDYFQFSYIYDVIVCQNHRGHGFGKLLIRAAA